MPAAELLIQVQPLAGKASNQHFIPLPPLPPLPPLVAFSWVVHLMCEPVGDDQRQWHKWTGILILPLLPCISQVRRGGLGWEFGTSPNLAPRQPPKLGLPTGWAAPVLSQYCRRWGSFIQASQPVHIKHWPNMLGLILALHEWREIETALEHIASVLLLLWPTMEREGG